MNPTNKGLEVLEAIYRSEYQSSFGSATIDHAVYQFSVLEKFGTSAGGIVARLLEQGFIGVQSGYGDDSLIWLTADGYLALCESVKEVK